MRIFGIKLVTKLDALNTIKTNREKIREYYYDSAMTIDMIQSMGFNKKEILKAIN